MLTNYCYQTDIRFQSLNCPVPSPLLCGLDIGYSGIKIQSPCNASIIPSIVVKARNDSPLLINGEDIRYRDEKGQMWYVGSLAKKTLLYGSTAIKSTTLLGRQRVQSEEFLVQSRIGFFFAKLRGLPEGGYDMDERPLKVQTGLPPEFIVQDTETLLQRLTGEHSFYVRIGKRPWLNVKVKLERRDIHVCKQPFGTLMSSVISEAGVMTNPALLKKNVLILDAGFHTTDTYHFIRCGHCGYAMNFHETKYPYYICHARQADNDLHCQGTRIMESDLAEVVLNALKQFAQVCIDSERRLEKRREVMRSERAQIQEKIKQQEKIAAKLLLEGNDCFEELLEGKIDDQEYTTRMAENNRKVAECQKQVDALNETLQSMPEVPDAMSEKTLIGKILSLERLDRKLADLTVKCIHVFKDGSLQIEWNFSGLFDSMFPQDLLEVLPRTETVMLNRTWIYCCTVDGWDELERMRQELFAYAEGRQWLVVGDSFDNSKPCLEANGFRQMRDAAKQGRVDNVLVYTLDGLSKRSKNYARFQRQIEKRHVLMYDRNGNLLIGA